ncbi:MAG: E3 binding domain-containing protein [Anaerolineales bacterium]|uniref:biotin/lipoyl-containing protein n=1 Tax=Candidatus Villigracilis proximus TaxID=3140683 RepID=UPI00313723E9|nr:E3 binding domain-containing protein [Anaerolineales bacterium]
MAETISMPKLGFDMAEGLLVRWVKQVGETINKGDVLAEIETDKATVEVESSASGVVLQLIVDQGTMVPVNAAIAIVGAAGEVVSGQLTVDSKKVVDEKPAPQTQPTVDSVAQTSAPLDAGSVKASPLAKKIARDQKVDLSNVQGTGPGGRLSARILKPRFRAGSRQKSAGQTVE